MSEKIKRDAKDGKPQVDESVASRVEDSPAARSLSVSRSLMVGAADDPEEGQADRMADLALRHLNSGLGGSTVGVSRSLTVGRADDPEEGQADRMADLALRKISGFENANTALRKSSIDDPLGGTAVDSSVESQIQSKLGGGSTLREREASGFSNAYGVDLSGVRVHSDSVSDDLSRSLQADAFTVGSDVFFRGGLYQPGTGAGDRLLGHELAHVAIQSGHGLERMRSDVEAKRSESAAYHEPTNILRNATAGNVPEIRRAKKDGDSGAKGSKKERRNALLQDDPASAPTLMTLKEFTHDTRGNALIHRGSFFSWFENASDVLKQKLKAYEAIDDGYGLRDSNNRIRYTLLHEIEEICETYLSKREVSRTKDHGDMESTVIENTDREPPGVDNFVGEGYGEIANGKFEKIMAISRLQNQAKKGKADLKKAGLGRDAEDLEASANKDKKVTKMKKKYDPQTAGTFFSGLAAVIGLAGGGAGESKEIEINTLFEVAPLIYVGVVVVIKARTDLNNNKGGLMHANLQLKGRLEAGLNVGFGKLEGHVDLGFFLEAKAMGPEQLASWFSLGAYDKFRSLLPESTVNYLWFGSGGENFNKAKADEWMARIDKAVNDYPEENEEKYKAKKDESKEAAKERANALAEDRQAWADQAQETYVRAGLVGELSGSAKIGLLKDKIDGAARYGHEKRVGTSISAASLDKYVNKNKVHDRSYSESFSSYVNAVDVSYAGWQGVLKLGVNSVGGDARGFLDIECKTPAPWPASSFVNFASVLKRSIQQHTKKEASKKEKSKARKDAAKSLKVEAAFNSSDISNLFSSGDDAQKKREENARAAMTKLTSRAAGADAYSIEENIYNSVLSAPQIAEQVGDTAGYANDLVMDGAKDGLRHVDGWVSENITAERPVLPPDQAGFSGLSGGVAFKLKIEEKKGGGYDYHFIAASQNNHDRETPDALVKLGVKAKNSQTFFESKGTFKDLYDSIVEDLSYLGKMEELNVLSPEMGM